LKAIDQTKMPNYDYDSDSDSDSDLKVGDGLEISPLALASVEDIAMRVKLCGGAALFFDYGELFTQEDSIRGALTAKFTCIFLPLSSSFLVGFRFSKAPTKKYPFGTGKENIILNRHQLTSYTAI
jgi:hypothetical protein